MGFCWLLLRRVRRGRWMSGKWALKSEDNVLRQKTITVSH